ncbi:hypothetical protein T492DRAFT_466557 [Pavlovales sp. CCMP2436]|nr:hypothetical protein T492DRAFT_466557 [Pavlovales sp. CCMP2436]
MAGHTGCAAGRVSLAARSAVGLSIAAVLAYQQGLALIEPMLPFASFAAFIAILCADSTFGGTVRLSVDVVVGGTVAVLLHSPLLAVPAAVRSSEAFAAPILFAQCVVLAAPNLPNAIRRLSIAVGALLTLAPLVTPLSLEADFSFKLIATLALGAASALIAALIPPWSSARTAFEERHAFADRVAAECFQSLLLAFGAFCSLSDTHPEAQLVRPTFLLRELESLPELLASLRADAEWEPAWLCGNRTPRCSEARELWTRDQQRHLRRMERALRALANAVAEGTDGVAALHTVFAVHMRTPLARLSEQAGRVDAGGLGPRSSSLRGQGGPSGEQVISVAALD